MTNKGENTSDYDSWSDSDYEGENLTPGFLRPLTEAEKPAALERWNEMVETYNEMEARKAKIDAIVTDWTLGTSNASLLSSTQIETASVVSGTSPSTQLKKGGSSSVGTSQTSLGDKQSGKGYTKDVAEMFPEVRVSNNDDERATDSSLKKQKITKGSSSHGAKDRGVIKCHNMHSTLRNWNVQREDARSLIVGSGLFHLSTIMYKYIDGPLISAFVERWHSTTNTFHLPFGEMTITLHDVVYVLNIPIDGHPVVTTLDSIEALSTTLGLKKDQVKGTLWKTGRLNLEKLKTLDVPEMDASVVAKGYLLSLLGASLFVDKSGNSVNGSFSELLNKLEEVKGYAWGTATLANLYNQLRAASKNNCRQIAGCLTLLQAWIYAYFPELRPQERSDWQPGSPHASKWIPEKGSKVKKSNDKKPNDEKSLKNYRKYLDHCSSSSVEWTPFSANPKADFPISSLNGNIQCRSITETYMPDRVNRQFGSENIEMVPSSSIPSEAFNKHKSNAKST